MLLFPVAIALQLVALTLSAPTTQTPPDAPFSVNKATIEASITCPNGLHGKQTVLLVHGTTSTGKENWALGPYVNLLPAAGQGYDVCWIDLPHRSLTDAQLSAEYVAYAVQFLAPKSRSGKVDVIGHSQGGGLNIQWALVFWPSIQSLVSNYVGLAPDFRGTDEAQLICNPLTAPLCEPALWQQSRGSHYLKAQNSMLPGGGGRALVPTTSLYSNYDEVIQSEVGPGLPTSFLNGAGVHALQDPGVCGPLHFVEHLLIALDPGAYALTLLTLEKGGPVDLSSFDPIDCISFKAGNPYGPGTLVQATQALLGSAGGYLENEKTLVEPSLQPYVCSRGFAVECGDAF